MAHRLEVDAEVVEVGNALSVQMAERGVDEFDARHRILGLGLLGVHLRLAQVVLDTLDGVEGVGNVAQPECPEYSLLNSDARIYCTYPDMISPHTRTALSYHAAFIYDYIHAFSITLCYSKHGITHDLGSFTSGRRRVLNRVSVVKAMAPLT
jgi:hypothetical protein